VGDKREQLLNDLAECIRIGHRAVIQGRPEKCPEAVRWKDAFEYWSDLLMDDPDGQQDWMEDVAARCRRILTAEKEKPRPVRAHRAGQGSCSAEALHSGKSQRQYISRPREWSRRCGKWQR